jgi:hypothetical protein
MDITPQDNTQPISDDQELAKALAGVLPEDDSTTDAHSPTGMKFEETAGAVPAPTPTPVAPLVMPDVSAPVAPPSFDVPSFSMPAPSSSPAPLSAGAELDGIKLDALKELRPLMDKVDLPAEEKFDTYLMLIRSTDDKTLIAPAHTAAQGIADEKRKAEALLEIIKEIDYLSRKAQPAA